MLKMKCAMFIKNGATLLLLWIFLLATPAAGNAQQPNRALKGVSSVKVYYDVNVGKGKKLATRLMLINKTFSQLEDAGVQSQFIVGFRGKASRFMTKGSHYVLEEDVPNKKQVHSLAIQLIKKGIRLEQCRIAADLQAINPNDFLPGITVIQNGYISMIGYQTKGFVMIPMD